MVDAEAAERDDHRRERAAALGQRVARAQRALAVALARDEPEILEPAQPAGEQVGRDRLQRAREVAVARDAAQQVAHDQQRPAIADGIERRRDRAVVGVGGHGDTLHRIVTRFCLVVSGGEVVIAYVDGKWTPAEEARISVLDHGLLYGDGVFEGIRVYGGRPFLLDEHLDRLEASARAIVLELPAERDEIAALCREAARARRARRRLPAPRRHARRRARSASRRTPARARA